MSVCRWMTRRADGASSGRDNTRYRPTGIHSMAHSSHVHPHPWTHILPMSEPSGNSSMLLSLSVSCFAYHALLIFPLVVVTGWAASSSCGALCSSVHLLPRALLSPPRALRQHAHRAMPGTRHNRRNAMPYHLTLVRGLEVDRPVSLLVKS